MSLEADEKTGERIELKNGKPGELWLRSDSVMRGYYSLNEEDKSTTDFDVDSNRWLHTGDVVYADADGFYYVVDRMKNLIKVNGLPVSSVELVHSLLRVFLQKNMMNNFRRIFCSNMTTCWRRR